MMCASTPQVPLKIPHIPTNRDYKALNRATLGGLGGSCPFKRDTALPNVVMYVEAAASAGFLDPECSCQDLHAVLDKKFEHDKRLLFCDSCFCQSLHEGVRVTG